MTQYIRAVEQPVTVDIRIIDGLFVKSTTFPHAGMIAPQHSHSTGHLSGIAAGAVEVERDGISLGYFEAPALIPIKARARHLFRVLKPMTCVWCIFATADFEGDEPDTHEEHHLTFAGET